ncbi:hypothetical protein RB195_008141 [Necator americanus]|uniref:Uncharacterized protein n=1 Tax=Necator americanus TaxID=51031 RepID=A0ABR1CM69_NECAM
MERHKEGVLLNLYSSQLNLIDGINKENEKCCCEASWIVDASFPSRTPPRTMPHTTAKTASNLFTQWTCGYVHLFDE